MEASPPAVGPRRSFVAMGSIETAMAEGQDQFAKLGEPPRRGNVVRRTRQTVQLVFLDCSEKVRSFEFDFP